MNEPAKSDLTRRRILSAGRSLVITHGFGSLGLSRILSESGVPKGSFYYYFTSKEAFGLAMLSDYVADYLERFDALADSPESAGDRLLRFWSAWITAEDGGIASQCLVVKLGAEVADLSDGMRRILDDGVGQLVHRIAALLREGADDGSLRQVDDPETAAQMLYARWLGAAILSKLARNDQALHNALKETRQTFCP
ncbi:TetR/AcrR family transcriptional regulator [Pseudooceanicola aestuarii]|uniref:TetR/AcrR family transcriptional regulator n=1 Tax=Pseudooceanicola aestuarii TaxID=2697319 RepID=UPI0013CF8423|nr:TetR/AcrR family transcriptional regulator [Pseudooceanicola aestuarii]